jgi:hypothetical protein
MPGKFESLADDKLERAIVERLQALGLLAHLPESDTRYRNLRQSAAPRL